VNRQRIGDAIRDLYAARLSNDPATCLACFAAGATFRLAGSTPAGDPWKAAQGSAAIRSALEALTEAWTWSALESLAVLIDGREVATRYRVTATHAPSDTTIVTEVMDHIAFDEDARILDLVEFVDTAMVERLSGSAHA
jgi:ketosteroid isomerase-like protein